MYNKIHFLFKIQGYFFLLELKFELLITHTQGLEVCSKYVVLSSVPWALESKLLHLKNIVSDFIPKPCIDDQRYVHQ